MKIRESVQFGSKFNEMRKSTVTPMQQIQRLLSEQDVSDDSIDELIDVSSTNCLHSFKNVKIKRVENCDLKQNKHSKK